MDRIKTKGGQQRRQGREKNKKQKKKKDNKNNKKNPEGKKGGASEGINNKHLKSPFTPLFTPFSR
jgi:hypothetical protein